MSKKERPLPPIYNELSQVLFMIQMSYINPSSVDIQELISRADELIALMHANNVIEFVQSKNVKNE